MILSSEDPLSNKMKFDKSDVKKEVHVSKTKKGDHALTLVISFFLQGFSQNKY